MTAASARTGGYLLAGKITVSYADREETYQAGDAFYMTPGHVPAAETGTEFIQFSPKELLAETMAVIKANAQRVMQAGSWARAGPARPARRAGAPGRGQASRSSGL